MNRINELEAELENLYEASAKLDWACDVISTYKGFYDAVSEELNPTNDEDTCNTENLNSEYEEAAARLTSGFKNLLEEIFGRK